MKLKYFSEQTFPKQMGGGSKTPSISLGKGGIIQLNKRAAELLELKEGDKITIAQDEDDEACWYVFKDPNHGFALRGSYDSQKQAGALLLNHKKLQTHICESLELNPDETRSFIIAGQPTTMKGDKTKYWGLLVKSKV